MNSFVRINNVDAQPSIVTNPPDSSNISIQILLDEIERRMIK